ncbi:threonine dehydrogenase-like Zn-dependent dehydrogenase [Sphingobium sp. OAS761]|uniref:zinc-dependent alcohol dehydrogenase n=1 Tax=Sphingobium sp. OAS761 TaxID=2817901 RepID=UPI00209F413A|nr:zinc-binding dehydrogenase [Sphingobium sp. OAS761]MCP1470402.1 threonine dehydrogenase-like Zn-dependent dehydrogenase [Sphingobium sp. OAS761]
MMAEVMPLARVHGPGDVRLDDVPVPLPADGEVIVRVAACGICGSDLGYIAQGGLGGVEPLSEPLPIGHEFAGTIEAVGRGVSGLATGQRVAVNPDHGYIGGGGPEGAMAPFIRVRGASLGETVFPLPGHVSFAQAALAEPLSVGLHAIERLGIAPHDKVAILGAGPIGLCTVAMLRSMGAEKIAIFDRVETRLERARILGAGLACNVDRQPMVEALAEFHGAGERFGAPHVETDAFIDCAGSPQALTQAFGAAKYRARIAVVALHKNPVALDLWRMMANEILITGSIAVDRAEAFGKALAMIAREGSALAPLISHHFDFADFHEALRTAASTEESAKVMLTFADNAA